MGKSNLYIIRNQTRRMMWNLKNVIACIPDEMWEEIYCEMPLYKHIYHTLHSLDQWLINPERYTQPDFHVENLNNLDAPTDVYLSRQALNAYAEKVYAKINAYLDSLTEEALGTAPDGCIETQSQLILAQYQHLNLHAGMLMGFVIAKTGKWPFVLGLKTQIPGEPMPLFY